MKHSATLVSISKKGGPAKSGGHFPFCFQQLFQKAALPYLDQYLGLAAISARDGWLQHLWNIARKGKGAGHSYEYAGRKARRAPCTYSFERSVIT